MSPNCNHGQVYFGDIYFDDVKKIYNLIRGLSPVLNENQILKDLSIFPAAWSTIINKTQKNIVKIYESDFELQKHNLKSGTIITDNKKNMKVAGLNGFVIIKKILVSKRRSAIIKSLYIMYNPSYRHHIHKVE